MIRNLLALLGLASITLAAAIALQAYGYLDDEPPARVPVSYTGLDLSTPEGVRMLEQRIDAAIDDICEGDHGSSLIRRRDVRECRREAIAGVAPQVDRAVARARERTAFVDREFRGPPPQYDRREPPPPPVHTDPVAFAPPQEVVQPIPPEYSRRRVRRTTTTTVTTTRPAPARKVGVRHAAPPTPHYGRRAPVAGSWLPPSAWRAIERATARAFVTGRLVRWYVPGREGYVTVSPARWIDGCACRAVRVVKYAGSRQIVVADGTRCRLPGGGLTG